MKLIPVRALALLKAKYAAVRDPIVESLFGHIEAMDDFVARLMGDNTRLRRELEDAKLKLLVDATRSPSPVPCSPSSSSEESKRTPSGSHDAVH